MSKDIFQSIVLFSRPESNGALMQIAQHLKDRHKSHLVLLVGTEQDKQFYQQRFPTLFDAVESMQFRYRSVFEPLEDEQEWLSRARAMEERFQFQFSDLLMDDRHFGLGYSAAGTNYVETRWSRVATYAKALRSYVLFMQFFDDLLRKHKTTLVINPTKACCVVARPYGVPVRFLTSSCFKNYWTWTVNEYMESNLLPAAFKMNPKRSDEELDRHYDSYIRTRADMFRRFTVSRMLRNVSFQLLRYAYYHIRRYEKRLGMLPFENARAHYRIWSGFRQLKKQRLRGIEDLENRRFVYFPLSVEPEVTLTRESPEFNHQPFAIHAIAKALPADTLLAVKEHVGSIGHRPPTFYRDLAKIPNVVLVDPAVWGLDLIKRSLAVATVSGTSGFEAAVLGIPVLTFSQHVRYKIIPHVRQIEGWKDIPAAIADVLAWGQSDLPARKAAGKVYLDALVTTSVDCGDANFREQLDRSMIEKLVALLERSLQLPDAAGEWPASPHGATTKATA